MSLRYTSGSNRRLKSNLCPSRKSINPMTDSLSDLLAPLCRIADALERMAPDQAQSVSIDDMSDSDAFLWQAASQSLQPVAQVSRISAHLLRGIERQHNILHENTRCFADGLPANNALLWGARGMGKSSLVKAIHAEINADKDGKDTLALIEINREDLASLPQLLNRIRNASRRCLVYCDDLSFEKSESSYKSLKAILEGGIEGRPDNVLFYATSNRRHLMPRDMIENESSSAINPGEAVDESVSLSDRFGLWLGFHGCDQETYRSMVRGYADESGIFIDDEQLFAKAQEWSITRGARSGRVAWQFIQHLAGEYGKTIKTG